MYFDPKTDKFPYTENTDGHYITIKKDNGIVFDKDYPYFDGTKTFAVKKFFVRVLLRTIVFPMMRIRLGIRIKGRKNIVGNKSELNRGALSCSNHVHFWDYIAVMRAVLPYKPSVLVWSKNVNGESGALVRLTGGVPIPENDLAATMKYLKETENYLKGGGFLHVYAEGSMWEYYAPIRPFKAGLGYFACVADKPVVPMAFSYRRPGFIREKIFGQIACFDLNIGELIYPDKSLPFKERERDLVKRCHESVCRLAGIEPKDNLYPPVYSGNKRIEY